MSQCSPGWPWPPRRIIILVIMFHQQRQHSAQHCAGRLTPVLSALRKLRQEVSESRLGSVEILTEKKEQCVALYPWMLFWVWAILRHFSHKLKKLWSSQHPPSTSFPTEEPPLSSEAGTQQSLSQLPFGRCVGVWPSSACWGLSGGSWKLLRKFHFHA